MKNYTWHIHLKGQVQGVGFRPFVYQQAQALQLTGWVNNTFDGVHAKFNADESTAKKFYQSLIEHAPKLSTITDHNIEKAEPKSFQEFKIIHSNSEGERNLLLTPDFAMCKDCREELFDDTDRRNNYPFITCTNCGPRYSIIANLPYDRETTTMNAFEMCDLCDQEYQDPLDRRYYSQTNSCDACGIAMSLFDSNQELLSSDTQQILAEISDQWQQGKIIAIKGIGGYLLTCDASNGKAIQTLRKRKQRPAKPFAVMYPGAELLGNHFQLAAKEKDLLTGAVSPIVLLDVNEKVSSKICHTHIAPGLKQLGVMLPYTPLYALLLKQFGKPIIATSGNITNSPIVYTDEEALTQLSNIADYLLTNNRKIAVPQDDSVIAFARSYRQKIIYRRSRGLAPTYINPRLKQPKETILATGAMLKSTFTFLHNRNVFISQYLGDLDHFDTQQNYRHTVDHFFKLFAEQPDLLLADQHSDYFSTRFAEDLSQKLNIPLKKYQHHIAHFAAVLGEHALLDSKELILGIIWDGTGLGSDGNIWGGEFFTYSDFSFNRCGQMDYFDFIAGDKMPREPRISALAATCQLDGTEELLKPKFTDLEWKNYHTLLAKDDNLQTSSAGRLFDAVSSLLGIMDRCSYEGEAAILLESQAREFINVHGISYNDSYMEDPHNFSCQTMLQAIIDDIKQGTGPKKIGARFHHSLVDIIAHTAEQQNTNKIAFSGGVFQNALLVDLLLDRLGRSYKLYFHQKLSPNDENISFGQLMCFQINQLKQK